MTPVTLLADVCLLAQQVADDPASPTQPVLMRLDGGTRAKVLAALAGLILLGFLLMTLTWLGARMARRYMGSGQKLGPTSPASDEEWNRPADSRR
jgi:hypothetical protein